MHASEDSLTVTIVASLAEAEALVPEWDQLALASASTPFATPLLALAWWRHLGEGELRIVVVRDSGGRLVGLGPLHERRIGPVRAVRWLGHGLGTVAEALVHPEHLGAADTLWRAAADGGRVLDLIESREARPLPTATTLPRRRAPRVVERDVCPVIDVRGDSAVHLEGPRSRRIRRTVTLARRRLDEAAKTFRVEVAHDLDTLGVLWPSVHRVFDAAEAHQPRQHLLRGSWGAFHTAVVEEGVVSGAAMVQVAFIDDEPVAFEIVLLTEGTMWSWVKRFEPVSAPFTPGHLLQCAGLDHAAAHGYTTFDLLLGDGVHKQMWATRSYRTLGLESGPTSALAVLHAVAKVRTRLRGSD